MNCTQFSIKLSHSTTLNGGLNVWCLELDTQPDTSSGQFSHQLIESLIWQSAVFVLFVIMSKAKGRGSYISHAFRGLPQRLVCLTIESLFKTVHALDVGCCSGNLHKKLNHVERIVHSAKDKIEGLTPRPNLDSSPLQHLEVQVGSLNLLRP